MNERPKTKAAWVAHQLRSSIIAGEIAPGDRILIRDVVNEFRVSSTPVRDALKTLQNEGYIQLQSDGIASVVTLSSAEYHDLYMVRDALDALAAELATERLDEDARSALVAQLRETNSQLRDALVAGRTDEASILNVEWHRAIYESNASKLLAESARPAWRQFPIADALYWTLATGSPDVREELYDEHEAITAAIERGDKDAAKAAAHSHLRRTVSKLRKAEDQRNVASDVSRR